MKRKPSSRAKGKQPREKPGRSAPSPGRSPQWAVASSKRPSPQTRQPARRRAKKILLYTVSPANDGLVFATPERAAFVSRLYAALEGSTTWAEFRRSMPRAEYARVIRRTFDENGEPRPRGCDPFSSADIPGYCDGDYPPWLQQEMDDLLPVEVIERFGEGQVTMLNGGYTHLDPKDLPEIIAMLERHGYVVQDGSRLNFW
jgi:hypothetical protein